LKGFALAECLLRRGVSSMKKELIDAHLTLTDGESTSLWQVYEQYSTEMSKINDTRTAILEEYSEEYDTLTDDQATISFAAGLRQTSNKQNCVSSSRRSFGKSYLERKPRPSFNWNGASAR
jgi:hypothetical protein